MFFKLFLRLYLGKTIYHNLYIFVITSKKLFSIDFVMGYFNLSLLKNIKKKNDSAYMRFVYVAHVPERENKQCADILLIQSRK